MRCIRHLHVLTHTHAHVRIFPHPRVDAQGLSAGPLWIGRWHARPRLTARFLEFRFATRAVGIARRWRCARKRCEARTNERRRISTAIAATADSGAAGEEAIEWRRARAGAAPDGSRASSAGVPVRAPALRDTRRAGRSCGGGGDGGDRQACVCCRDGGSALQVDLLFNRALALKELGRLAEVDRVRPRAGLLACARAFGRCHLAGARCILAPKARPPMLPAHGVG